MSLDPFMRAEIETAIGAKKQPEREETPDLVDEIGKARRVVIAGGPKTGKSTLSVRAAERHGLKTRHADSLVGKLDWSGGSEEVSRWFDEDEDQIVEGVSTPRAIRKWLRANPGKPFGATVVFLQKPLQKRSKGQEAMAKGVATVWKEILPELRKRGAKIIFRDGER